MRNYVHLVRCVCRVKRIHPSLVGQVVPEEYLNILLEVIGKEESVHKAISIFSC